MGIGNALGLALKSEWDEEFTIPNLVIIGIDDLSIESMVECDSDLRIGIVFLLTEAVLVGIAIGGITSFDIFLVTLGYTEIGFKTLGLDKLGNRIISFVV
jgi:hypothetical protein